MFTGYAWTGRLPGGGSAALLRSPGPKDNPEMESFLGRFKVENRSLILDAESIEETQHHRPAANQIL